MKHLKKKILTVKTGLILCTLGTLHVLPWQSFISTHAATHVITHAAIDKPLNVVTTSQDLASIAQEVGGSLVKVRSLARGGDDLHYLPARPDFMLKTNKADVFLLIGAELEIGWAPLVLKQSRNAKVQPGLGGYCDVSKAVRLLQRKKGEINRQMGDIHPAGNPHYWIDPVNGIRMAKYIAKCFSLADSKNQTRYQKNFEAFKKRAKILTKKLLNLMKPHFGKTIISYHNELVYLAKRFRLKIPMNIEEIPGVSPGSGRIKEVVQFIRSGKVRLVAVTPWSNVGIARKIAQEAKAELLVLPIQTGSSKGTETYLKMIETTINMLAQKL